MCCRFASPSADAIQAAWPQLDIPPDASWKVGYNVAPTDPLPLLIPAPDHRLKLIVARWGLIPRWWPAAQPPNHTFNARVEEADRRPAWRENLRSRRALLPILGWYEWHQTQLALTPRGDETTQPYYFHIPGTPVLALAALWDEWADPASRQPVRSCALLTRPALDRLAPIHHRTPAILNPREQAAWLAHDASPAALHKLIASLDPPVRAHPVSTRVNSVRNDDAQLIEPIRPIPISLF